MTYSDKILDPVSDKIARLTTYGLSAWLKEAVSRNASDIFLSAAEPPMLKIYGIFKQLDSGILGDKRLYDIIHALLSEDKLARFREYGEVDMGFTVEGLSRFRVNVFRQHNGHAVAIRPLSNVIPNIKELKLPDIYNDVSRLERGLVLITGPVGSGKTTTLAALINMINNRDQKHVVTIEDPIEYVIPSKISLIHQREVGIDTHSFATGLRNALRENPDVIVVGELRDLESIALAVRAAETGILVLGTLHSGNAVQALTRILDVFDAQRQVQIRTQLAQSLQVICAQRLFKLRNAEGVIVATEVLVATLAVRNIIRANRLYELHGYIETGQHERMHSFQQSIQGLIDQGLVDINALLAVEDSPIPTLP